MKNVHKWILPFFLACLGAFAADKEPVILPYQWKAFHTYTYQSEFADGTLDIMLDVLECNREDCRILARIPSLAPDHALLFSMDKHGSVKSRRFLGSPDIYDAALGEAQQVGRLGGPLGLSAWLKADVWELPPEGLTPNKPSKFHGRNYVLKDCASTDTGKLCRVETSALTVTHELSSNRIYRVFDVQKGTLLEYGDYARSGLPTTRLASIVPLKADVVAKRLENCAHALDEDAFRMRVCVPYLASTYKWAKKKAYFCLSEIQDQSLMPQVYSELSKAAGSNWEFSTMADSFLFRHVERGEEWTISALQREEWSQLDQVRLASRISKMERLTGLKLERDYDRWKLWFRTVRERLPRLRESPTQELREAAEWRAQPWVRLFAIRELCTRADEDVKAILENARVDEMSEVRDFVAGQLMKSTPRSSVP